MKGEAIVNNLNSVLIEGELAGDPELSFTPQGIAKCTFVVTCHRSYKEDGKVKEEKEDFDVTAWNRLAETCGEYLKKGRGVRVVGRLTHERWTEDEGQHREQVIIIAEHMEFRPQLSAKKAAVEEATAEDPA